MRIPTLVLPLALSACFGIGGPEHRETDSLTFDGGIEQVSFELAAGDLTVRVQDVATAELHRTWRYRGERPDVDATLTGDLLSMKVKCRSALGGCSVDHELILPAGADVWGSTGSGDIAAEGIGGLLDVETGSGDVIASGLGSQGALVDTGSGDVTLDFDQRPDEINVDTGSGDVRIDLPRGAYDVSIDTGSGDIVLTKVSNNQNSDNHIDIDTGSGDVSLRGY